MITFRPRTAPAAHHHRPRPAGRFVLAAVTIGLAGCSPATDGQSPRAPITVSAGPATTATLDSRLVATIDLASPDGLVEVSGAVWVKTDDGRVPRIDPGTDTVTGTVQLDTATDPSHYCQGIGTDGTAVWACTASDSATGIVRIDPTTMAVGEPVAVDKVFDELSLRTTVEAYGCSPPVEPQSPWSIRTPKRRPRTRSTHGASN